MCFFTQAVFIVRIRHLIVFVGNEIEVSVVMFADEQYIYTNMHSLNDNSLDLVKINRFTIKFALFIHSMYMHAIYICKV